jgi:hypothetical protein
MLLLNRTRLRAAARAILEQRDWCMLEVCVDVPNQRWEPRVVICVHNADTVVDAVAGQVTCEPDRDARLVGCDRRSLRPEPTKGSHLCYLADLPVPGPARELHGGEPCSYERA